MDPRCCSAVSRCLCSVKASVVMYGLCVHLKGYTVHAQGFKEAVQTNLHWFEGTQLIVISNTLWVGEQVMHACEGLPRIATFVMLSTALFL